MIATRELTAFEEVNLFYDQAADQIGLADGVREMLRSMLYEVDVVAEGNSPLDLNRVFSLLSEPQPITKLITANPLGEDIWCDVVGWNEDGPGTAYAVEAEDSGEGVILLIYGGH